jgi:hypothetical protein
MEQKADVNSVFLRLKTTLSKLCPIERWTVTAMPDALHQFAPTFCWEFFRPDPEMLARLSEAVRSYDGSVGWGFGPPSANAICLVPVERGSKQFVGYPPIDRPEAFSFKDGAQQKTITSKEFIDQAVADVPQLCSYLERHLRLENLAPESFDSRLIAPPDPPSFEGAPFDFVERGMHVAWILHGSSTAGQEGSNTALTDRRMLHFSVSEDEWRAIHADIIDSASPANAISRTDPFPLLSRISESESAYFRGMEVPALREECLRARSATSTPLAIRGLDKLILICNWAQHMAGDILLRAP